MRYCNAKADKTNTQNAHGRPVDGGEVAFLVGPSLVQLVISSCLAGSSKCTYAHTLCLCCLLFRDVYPFIYFIIAMYVHHLGLYCILFRRFLISKINVALQLTKL